MMSSLENIDAQKMRNPAKDFVDGDWTKTTMAMGKLGKMPIHIFDKSGVDIGYIRQKCRLLKRMYPDKHIIIMIDYLQLIIGNPKHGGNRTAEISEISRMLKHIARDLDITVIALSQLSRAVEQRQDKRPMMSDLRESGQIEQDADVIGFLYRDDYYDKESENKNIVEVIIAKQRNGPTGTIQLAFMKEYNKFINLSTRYDN
jgi:replicative DNA helicase